MVILGQSMIIDLNTLVNRAKENGLSMAEIALQAQRSKSTISRILNGEQTKTNVETIVNILSVVSTIEEEEEFLKAHFANEYQCYSKDVNKGLVANQPAVDFFLQNRYSFAVYQLLKVGFRRSEIIAFAGNPVLPYVENALNLEYAVENEEGIIFQKGDSLKIRRHSDAVKATFLASEQSVNMGLPSPYHTSFKRLGANEKAAKKIQDLSSELYNQIVAIDKDPKMQGKIPLVFYIGMTSITKG